MPEYYVYEAALHCPEHARQRFGKALDKPETTDGEGNPLGAVFSWDLQGDECCDECVAEMIARRNRRKGR